MVLLTKSPNNVFYLCVFSCNYHAPQRQKSFIVDTALFLCLFPWFQSTNTCIETPLIAPPSPPPNPGNWISRFHIVAATMYLWGQIYLLMRREAPHLRCSLMFLVLFFSDCKISVTLIFTGLTLFIIKHLFALTVRLLLLNPPVHMMPNFPFKFCICV